MPRKKLLLMGNYKAGKTTMRSIIFDHLVPDNTKNLKPTVHIEQYQIKILSHLVLDIWDCGGQEAFMENHFFEERNSIFRDTEVLVYVFDVESRDKELDYDMKFFRYCLDALGELSPAAKIFCLVHKMDLVHKNQRDQTFSEREAAIVNMCKPKECICYQTSICDRTLYKAWSSIISKLVPNVKEYEKGLNLFAEVTQCDEVLLLERVTLLLIAHYERVKHHDENRFEKVSNIIKRFKFSCIARTNSEFSNIEMKNSHFTAFVDLLTPFTYIMVIVRDPQVTSMLTWKNIKCAKKHFEKLEDAMKKKLNGDSSSSSSSSSNQ